MVLLATGSEVALACDAEEKLLAEGVRRAHRVAALSGGLSGAARGVPSLARARLTARRWWPSRRASGRASDALVGPRGLVYGIDRFGASAPMADLAEEFGFTPDKLAASILEHIRKDSD